MNEFASISVSRSSVVYFVQNLQTGAVKIGFTKDVRARLGPLETGAGTTLSLLRTIPGGRATERWLHRRFSQYAIQGEWFYFHQDMLTVVPPDEVPVRPKVTIRRDVRLTLRERVTSSLSRGLDLGLNGCTLLTLVTTSLSDQEASDMIALISESVGCSLIASSPHSERAPPPST